MASRILVVFIFLITANAQRICELQGTCYRCEHNRYSFYSCGSHEDCFPEEYCNTQRFCCPKLSVAPQIYDVGHNRHENCLEVSQSGYGNSVSPKCPDNSEWMRMCKVDADCIFRDEICAEGKCCPSCISKRIQILNEFTSISNDEFLSIKEDAKFVRSTSTSNLFDNNEMWSEVQIPQCAPSDSRFYSPMQCNNGTNDCFCVTKFGQRILTPIFAKQNNQTRQVTDDQQHVRTDQNDWKIDCNQVRQYFEKSSREIWAEYLKHALDGISPKFITGTQDDDNLKVEKNITENVSDDLESSTDSSNRKASRKPGFQSSKREYSLVDLTTAESNINKTTELDELDFLEIDQTGIRASPTWTSGNTTERESKQENNNNANAQRLLQPHHETCNDPLREFKVCGSSCPISCITRNYPKCDPDKCQRGCFCRLPYIILDSADIFGSKCVLPAECPLLPYTNTLGSWNEALFRGLLNTQNNKDLENILLSPSDVRLPNPNIKCSDLLKNYMTCGSACPAGCGALTTDCGLQCVSGCFCRAPFVLKDIKDINSPCIHPHHCPDFQPLIECTSRPNQIWTKCASKSRCLHSCEQMAASALTDSSVHAVNLAAACSDTDTCRPGCECRPPYIWSTVNETESKCVLPIDCPPFLQHFSEETTKTENIPTKNKPILSSSSTNKETCKASENKEYRNCASSCPLGCDNLQLRLCTPCVSGCFCNNGFIFQNSSNWRNSKCILAKECPETPSLSSSEESKTQSSPSTANYRDSSPTNNTKVITAVSLQCPTIAADQNGRSCENDFECGFRQKCCSHTPGIEQANFTYSASIGTKIKKCTCIDPNAVWLECGTICPDYCFGSEDITNRFRNDACPQICHPGCFCNSGYIKSTKDPASSCIPITKCPIFFPQLQSHHSTENFVYDSNNNASKQETKSGNNNEQSSTPQQSTITETQTYSPEFTTYYQKTNGYNRFGLTNDGLGNGENYKESLDGGAVMCGEALSSAVLYSINGARIGRLIVRPDYRPSKHLSYENRLIRITGELQFSALSYGAHSFENISYYLSIHQFSDTTINGCQSIGQPIILQLIEEDENGFVVTTSTKSIHIGSSATFLSSLEPTLVDRRILWPDQISHGTNPLIGHSLVLKTFLNTNNDSTEKRYRDEATDFIRNHYVSPFYRQEPYYSDERLLACAVLGIVPSC